MPAIIPIISVYASANRPRWWPMIPLRISTTTAYAIQLIRPPLVLWHDDRQQRERMQITLQLVHRPDRHGDLESDNQAQDRPTGRQGAIAVWPRMDPAGLIQQAADTGFYRDGRIRRQQGERAPHGPRRPQS